MFRRSLLEDKVILCTTDPKLRGTRTDHIPILTSLSLPMEKIDNLPAYNWWVVDWNTFRE